MNTSYQITVADCAGEHNTVLRFGDRVHALTVRDRLNRERERPITHLYSVHHPDYEGRPVEWTEDEEWEQAQQEGAA